MQVNRNVSVWINRFLDQWLPPILRDSKWLMYIPARLLFKQHAKEFLEFRDRAFLLTRAEFVDAYRQTLAVSSYQGKTDLNTACVDQIVASIQGKTVLDVGVGKGYVGGLLVDTYDVQGCDIVVQRMHPKIKVRSGSVEKLPYSDKAFDTVLCCHVLEHVPDIHQAIAELRRVAKRRLIVVVPKQRPYRYCLSMHVHFFPYDWSLIAQFGKVKNSRILDFGDWMYIEDLPGSVVVS